MRAVLGSECLVSAQVLAGNLEEVKENGHERLWWSCGGAAIPRVGTHVLSTGESENDD